MRYDFDSPINRRGMDSIKWDMYDEDVLPLWIADMDFASPAPVVHALRERVAHGVFGYPGGLTFDGNEFPEFRQLIVDQLRDRWRWVVRPEDIVFMAGVVVGVNLACHAMSASGGNVVVQTPVYTPILNAPQTAGLDRRDAPLLQLPDGLYGIDWEVFASTITPETRLFILCNPHNPVGRVYRRDELERVAEICLRRGVVVCSDEIHCDLLYSGQQHTPIASLDPDIAHNSITLIAPTKTFNLAGLQCSIAIIANPELRRRYMQAKQGLVGWVNLIGLLAAQVAYRDGQDWLDQLLVYLEGSRDYLDDFVRRELPGISMTKPEGTYLAWLDCRRAGIEGNPSELFLTQARVALSDGAAFGEGGDGFVRLNFGCARRTLAEALARMKKSLWPASLSPA